MKAYYFIALLLLVLPGYNTTSYKPEDIPGSKWSQKGVFNGQPYEQAVIFRQDDGFDVTLNGKSFVNGVYELLGDTLFFSDPICNRTYKGSYKLHFKGDSLLFQVIADTCTARRETSIKGFKRME